MPSCPTITIEIGPGELLDKISILEIKSARMVNPAKLANVHLELDVLTQARDRSLEISPQIAALITELRGVNERLWEIEDELRHCERHGDFGERFVELARSVYFTNDRRAAVKRALNEHLNARIIEEKLYDSYEPKPAP